MIEKVKKNIFIAIAFSALIYLGLSFYANFNDVASAIEKFDWIYFIIILILSYLTFFTRYLKWEYYLRLLDIKISKSDSYQIFMSSLIMSVTPGKVGDLLKSYMLKKTYDIPVSETAPIVLAERITEFLSLLLIALVGIYFYDQGKLIVILLAFLVFGLVLILTNKKASSWILSKLANFRFVKKHINNFSIVLTNSHKMLQPFPFINMILLSLISWIFEGFGFYLILIKFGIDISLGWSFFIYAFSIIIGSIAMIPGGLGVTEGSLTLLLIESGATKNIAVAATFIFRVATLWFAVIIGVFSLVLYQKKKGKFNFEQIPNDKT